MYFIFVTVPGESLARALSQKPKAILRDIATLQPPLSGIQALAAAAAATQKINTTNPTTNPSLRLVQQPAQSTASPQTLKMTGLTSTPPGT